MRGVKIKQIWQAAYLSRSDYMASKRISKTEMLADIKKMNSFGTRLTGSEGQMEFINYLKQKIRDMGLELYCDPFYFKRWEQRDASLEIFGFNGPEDVHISSVFPYSGETPERGITAELFYVSDKIGGFNGVKDKIAVIEISEIDSLPSELAFDKRSSIPADLQLERNYDGPVATTFVKFQYALLARVRGAKAAIFVWKGMNKDLVEGQYLPFILDYQGIPAVWVNADDGKRIVEAALGHRTAVLKLQANTNRHAYTESFYCMLKGTSDKETVIVNTHTDGTNCVEENGAIAMLQLIKTMKDKPLKRNHIFVFVTGHFRLPSFKDSNGGGVQATSKWLSMHRDLWDGKRGHLKAVAGVSIEHLGCKEWSVVDGEYKETGPVQTELVYTGNKKLDDIYISLIKDRENAKTMTLRGHNFLHFGEGQPLFNVGIPEISIVTAPDYLCTVSDTHEMEKFDIDLMYTQTKTFSQLLQKLDSLATSEIGECDGYSLVTGKSVSDRNDISLKSLKKKVLSVIKK